MSKVVEKYEQMLAKDPASTAFVELARAYLETGENERAVTVCQSGLNHHPKSVVGRVLWGKALINLGKAAEAMGQFDQAVKIDRENPHAYNLISEVLLRKGLYRSAMPILRKAAQLQPNDGRIKQWLDQTKGALTGGPPPVLYDSTGVDLSAYDASVPPTAENMPTGKVTAEVVSAAMAEVKANKDVFAAFGPGKDDESADPTVLMGAYPGASSSVVQGEMLDEPPPPPVPTGELPVIEGRVTSEVPTAQHAVPAPDAPDPFAVLTGQPEAGDVVRGLTSTFDALQSEAAGGIPHANVPQGASAHTEGKSEPTVIPAQELLVPPKPSKPAGPQGLLDDVVSVQSEIPSEVSGVVPLPYVGARSAGGLLDDIPQYMESPSAQIEVPKVELNTQATEAIAREYERELRAKFEASTKKKTFLQQHGLKIVVGLVLTVLVGGLGGSFVLTRVKHRGESLDTAVGKGLAAITADTKESYVAAVASFDHALTMDDGSVEAWAYEAYAHAMLFAEHTASTADRDAASAALEKNGVRAKHPELTMVVEYLLAEPAALAAQKQAVLAAQGDQGSGKVLDQSELLTLQGRLLMADKKYDDALKRLQDATTLNPKNVRAFVALGEYYLAFEDWSKAAEMFGGAAATVSRYHPARVAGLARARLNLGTETAEALTDLEALKGNATVPPSQAGSFAVALGLALSANGRHDEALKVLQEALVAHKDLAYEIDLALGQASRAAGQMAAAQKAYEDALKLKPKSEEGKEGLGRVLLGRSRERELLDRLKPDGDGRKVALLRGIAAWRLQDYKRARNELGRTEVKGKFPAEAVVYLSMVEAAEQQQPDKAVELLKNVERQTKRHKATVQLALARLHMQRGALDEARTLLEEASKDPADYEANALLGELLLSAGVPTDIVMEPLQKAVARNGSHAPARHLLTKVLLMQGKLAEAQKNVDAWVADNPSMEAWRDSALVALQSGRLLDAENAVQKGLKPTVEDGEALRVRAQVLFARGDATGGFAALEFANTRLKLKDAATFCAIADAFVLQGVGETALAAYEAALKDDPKAICALVGPIHAHPGGHGRQRPELVKLAKASQNVWDKAYVQATLARSMMEDRDLKGARAMADEAVQTAPGHPAGWYALGEVAHRQKDPAKAIEAFSKVVELNEGWAMAHLLLADELAHGTPEQQQRGLAEYQKAAKLTRNENDGTRATNAAKALRKQLQ